MRATTGRAATGRLLVGVAALSATIAGCAGIEAAPSGPEETHGLRPVTTLAGGTASGNGGTTAATQPQPVTIEIRGLGRRSSVLGTSIQVREVAFNVESVRGFSGESDVVGEDFGGITFETARDEVEFEIVRPGQFEGAVKDVRRVGVELGPSSTVGAAAGMSPEYGGATVMLRGTHTGPRARHGKAGRPIPSPDRPIPSPDRPIPSPDHEFEGARNDRSRNGDLVDTPFVFSDRSEMALKVTVAQRATGEVSQIVVVVDLDRLLDAELFALFEDAIGDRAGAEIQIDSRGQGAVASLFEKLRGRFADAVTVELR